MIRGGGGASPISPNLGGRHLPLSFFAVYTTFSVGGISLAGKVNPGGGGGVVFVGSSLVSTAFAYQAAIGS